MNTSKKRTTEETKQILLDYMSNKYNEEFEITDIGIPAPLGKDIAASMVAKKDELKNEISVYWKFKETGEEFSDNYADLLYKFQVNTVMDGIVEENFSDYNYATYSDITRVAIDKYTNEPLTTLMTKTGMCFKTDILLGNDSMEQEIVIKERIIQMYEDIKKKSTKGIQFVVNVYICENKDLDENAVLFEKYKEMYTISGKDIHFTFNDYNDDYTKKVIKQYVFSTYYIENGVEEL